MNNKKYIFFSILISDFNKAVPNYLYYFKTIFYKLLHFVTKINEITNFNANYIYAYRI